jgi:23S rRNA pseudouridine1911/1915/1917 synthase
MPEKYEFTIGPKDQGQRLDKFLATHIHDVSRTLIKKWIDREAVTVSDHNVKGSHHLREGECIIVYPQPTKSSEVIPEDIPLDIIYEDEILIVINKPPGMVVHPAPGHSRGTLVNALLHHCGSLAPSDSPFRPGIVHRLDKGTTGVIVVAKTDSALRHLAAQFKDRTVHKVYHTFVYGEIAQEEGLIESSIGRDRVYRQKISSRTKKGREAQTQFQVLRRGHGLSFVKIALKTGRTHQIRVHLGERGYPLVGDQVYGGKGRWRQIKEGALQDSLIPLQRPLLQATELSLQHPKSNKNMIFNSELDSSFKELLKLLDWSLSYGSGPTV